MQGWLAGRLDAIARSILMSSQRSFRLLVSWLRDLELLVVLWLLLMLLLALFARHNLTSRASVVASLPDLDWSLTHFLLISVCCLSESGKAGDLIWIFDKLFPFSDDDNVPSSKTKFSVIGARSSPRPLLLDSLIGSSRAPTATTRQQSRLVQSTSLCICIELAFG